MTSSDASIRVVCYSRTGTTRTVAERVRARLPGASLDRIRPTRARSYPNWLARSSVPGSTVAIEPIRTDLRDRDAVVLATPKWTLSCPPVTAFCRAVRLDGVPTGIVLTYGGFDAGRYLDGLVRTLGDRGADVVATLRVKRARLGDDAVDDGVQRFCSALLDAIERRDGS